MNTERFPPHPRCLGSLRVAIEVQTLDRGGLETVVAELVRGLPAEGVAPIVICTEGGGAWADQLRSEGHAVEILTGADRGAEMAVLLRRRGVQLVNAHYSSIGTSVAAALQIPVVVTLHNAYAWLGGALYDEFRTLDRHVGCYIAVSEFVADFSARRFHIERDRIALVRNGIRQRGVASSGNTRADVRQVLGIPRDAEFVVQVASVSRVKGQLTLVEALGSLAQSRPQLMAWLVGSHVEADYAGLVRQRIVDLGLEERIALNGFRTDIDYLLAAADVFVLPSAIEGLSVAAVEALRAGVPAILTRTGDAEFLLGADRTSESNCLPGAIIDGPRIDPWKTDWRALRDWETLDHLRPARDLSAALREVLDDLPARRSAACGRGATLATLLSPEEMCRRTAFIFHRLAASHETTRAAQISEERSAIVAELQAERERSAKLEDRLGRVEDALREGLGATQRRLDQQSDEIRRHLDDLTSEARVANQTSWQALQVATRTLDKLRIGKRLVSALRSLGSPLGRPKEAHPGRSRPADIRNILREQPQAPVSCEMAEARSGSRGERWLILAVVPFDDIGGAQRSAQLARALGRRGASVTYASRFPRSESVDLGVATNLPGLELRDWEPDTLRRWIATLDERLILLVELPEREVVELAQFAHRQGARVVYDKIDAWEACDWATWYSPEMESGIGQSADDLVASARSLQRQLQRDLHRTVDLIPNAVDRSLFNDLTTREVPSDLSRGEFTLVYAGSLWGDWFDWEIVTGVARARPQWEVNLIGDPPSIRGDLPGNVRLLGLKPQTDLPAYYAAADVCLIPFAPGPVVEAVNPLKVYEYLAMNRPVVATPIPELAEVPYVFTANDVPTTISAIERAAATPPPVADLEAFLEGNTWEVRTAHLAGLVAEPTISIVVLCYNNEDVIGRCVDSLIKHRGERRYQVIVVDNGSSDASLDILGRCARRGDIALLHNDRNGCSSGRNLGLNASSSEIVVFLDSDQWALHSGWLDPALAILREHSTIGAVGWNAGWFDPGSGRGPIVDYLAERGMSGRYHGELFRRDVAYLATSGFVAPRSILARTDGFDEFYDPTCFEDTDLSFQIKMLGYELAYCPSLGVGHRPHQTTGALEGYESYLLRNERYFLDKWREHPSLFLAVPPE